MDEGQKLNVDLQSNIAEIKTRQWYREVYEKGEERHDIYYHVVEIHDSTLLVYTDHQERRIINRMLFEIDLEEGRLAECDPPPNTVLPQETYDDRTDIPD